MAKFFLCFHPWESYWRTACSTTQQHHRLPCFNIHPPEKNTFIEESLYQRSVQRIMGISGDTDHAPVLVHGDFGYHNVIFDLSGQSRVIDWEMAGGDPRIDLANVLFWTQSHLIGRSVIDCRSPDIIHSFVIFQFWRIIGLVKEDFPDHVKTEWNRCLAWAPQSQVHLNALPPPGLYVRLASSGPWNSGFHRLRRLTGCLRFGGDGMRIEGCFIDVAAPAASPGLSRL